MTETMSRVEIEDLFRHLTMKADRAQHQAECAMEEAKYLSRALEIVSYQIRQLTAWVVPLLSVEQQVVIGVEKLAGVTDEPLVTEDQVEANDGDEWRSRLRRRGLGSQMPTMMTRAQGAAMSVAEVAAFKALGGLFSPTIAVDGPCYNRDAGDVVTGLDDADL